MRDDQAERKEAWKTDTVRFPDLPLSERVEKALKFAEVNGQLDHALWPYQEFGLTIGELLNAAKRGA